MIALMRKRYFGPNLWKSALFAIALSSLPHLGYSVQIGPKIRVPRKIPPLPSVPPPAKIVKNAIATAYHTEKDLQKAVGKGIDDATNETKGAIANAIKAATDVSKDADDLTKNASKAIQDVSKSNTWDD
jgi:hypothetical protein